MRVHVRLYERATVIAEARDVSVKSVFDITGVIVGLFSEKTEQCVDWDAIRVDVKRER